MSVDASSGPIGALVLHLDRYPEDLRDIGRLQRRFGLSSIEVAQALDAWRGRSGSRQETDGH